MPEFLTRADREVIEVAGTGGMLRFRQPEYTWEAMTSDPDDHGDWMILDIMQWRVRHTLNLADVTHSGSYGADKFAMTGRGWQANLALAFNSNPSSNPWGGFLETLLVGNQAAGFNVSPIFFLGDPLNYVNTNHALRDSAKLYAPLALGEFIETTNNANGKDVVRLGAALKGNSKLQGWIGEDRLLEHRVF